MPTLVHIDGYEHQTLSSLRFGGAADTGLYANVTNTATMSFVAGRTGGQALRLASSAVSTQARRDFPAGGGHRIVSFYFRISAPPSSEGGGVYICDLGVGPTGISFRIKTDGTIVPTITATTGTPGPNVCDNAWHRLDFYLNTSANPWVLKSQIDGVALADHSVATTADTSGLSQNGPSHGAVATGMTVDYDDLVCSNTPADYPIGPHKVLATVPTSDGTHNTSGSVSDQGSGTTNLYAVLDEWPANLTDYVRQFVSAGTAYAEVNFADTTEPVIWGVEAIAALFSSAATANAGTTRIVDVSNTTLVDVYTSDMSETVLHYRAAMVPAPAASVGLTWGPGALNAVKARVGFSTNIASQPYWSALMLQYAVPEVTPNLIRVEGFEHQTLSANAFGGTDGQGLFDSITTPGSFTIDTTVERSGAACLKVIEQNGVQNHVYVGFVGSTPILVGSLYVRATTPPSVQSRILQGVGPTNSRKFFLETSGAISAGDNTQQVGPNVCDGNWHRIDFRFDASGTTHTIDWAVDGVAQTQHSDAGQTASLIDSLAIGSSNTTSVATYWIDDIVLSGTTGDYPIGPHKVLSVVPTGDGTHVPGTNVMETNTGADITAGSAFGLMDEWPANTSDYVQQVAVSTTSYAEVTFADTTETVIWGVEAAYAGFASGTTAAANGSTRIADSAGVALGDLMYGDMSETTLHYRRRGSLQAPGPGGVWTQTKFNSLEAQVGRSAEVTTQPRWSALMLQYAVPDTTTPVSASDSGVGTDTAAVTIGPTASDSVSAADAVSGRAATSSDAGTGADAVAAKASAVSESGTGLDLASVSTGPPPGVYDEDIPYDGAGIYDNPDVLVFSVSDSGVASDAAIGLGLFVYDGGIVIDVISDITGRPLFLQVYEQGAVYDSSFLSFLNFRFVSDAGFVDDDIIIFDRTLSDSMLASDSAVMNIFKDVTDLGTAADSAGITVSADVSDVGDADDVAGLVLYRTATDSGVGADLAQQATLKPVTDSGLGTDTRALLVVPGSFDSAVGSEFAIVAVPAFSVTDSAVAVDRAWQWGPIILVPNMQRLGEFGLAQQSGYSVPAAMASYSMPLGMPEGSGVPEPVVQWTYHNPARGAVALQEVRRELVPWLADFTIPAFIRPMPLLVQGLLSSDAVAGNLHTLTPGTNDIWFTFYSRRPGLAYERYTDGLIEGLRFDFTSGMPLQVGVQAQGREPEFLASAFTTNVLEDIRAGWLTYIGATVKFDWQASPATTLRSEAESGSLYISRPLNVFGNYRAVKPVGISRGNLAIELTVQLTFQNIDHYRYSVYGGLTTTPQGATVYGSAEITFWEWKIPGAGRYMKVTLPAVQWDVAPPQPLGAPESGHVLVDAIGQAIVPASIGRSGQPITVAVNT